MRNYDDICQFGEYLNEYIKQNPEDDCIDLIQEECKKHGWLYTDNSEGYYDTDYASDGQYILYSGEDNRFRTRLEESFSWT